jgi:hypothetical protein
VKNIPVIFLSLLLINNCRDASITKPDKIGKCVFDSGDVEGCDGEFESLQEFGFGRELIINYFPDIETKISAIAVEVDDIMNPKEDYQYSQKMGMWVYRNGVSISIKYFNWPKKSNRYPIWIVCQLDSTYYLEIGESYSFVFYHSINIVTYIFPTDDGYSGDFHFTEIRKENYEKIFPHLHFKFYE